MAGLEAGGIAISIGALTGVLGYLGVRGLVHAARDRSRHQLMFALGMLAGTAALAVELVAYVGLVDVVLLQAYIFLSAAIVGLLSLGSARSFRPGRFEVAYGAYMAAVLAVLAAYCFATPLPLSMVRQGIISGNPPLVGLLLSFLVTLPATVVLLTAAVLHLRKSFRPKTLLMISGACVLGAGGAFYIASFPVILYYAEFIGILMLFLGLTDIVPLSSAQPALAPGRAAP